MIFTDTVALDGVKLTRDGYLAVDAKIARTGIQLYSGREMGKPEMDTVRVFRPEAEVFAKDALRSFANRPVTNDHPSVLVDATNWRQHASGMTGDSVARDGDHVRVPFLLMDGTAIEDVREGKQELSCGYTAKIVWGDGVTPDGEAYDAMQTQIRGNHLALVDRGRAGKTCRIGDSWAPDAAPSSPAATKEPRTMADSLRAVLVDGVTYQMTDQGAQLIERIQAQLADTRRATDAAAGEVAALKVAHATALEQRDGVAAATKAQHDAALQAKDGEIAALKAAIPDAAALDALSESRSRTVQAAKVILGSSYDARGKALPDIKRAAVAKKLGDAAVKDRSDDYVGACFDTLSVVTAGGTAIATANPMALAIAGAATVVDADSAKAAFDARQELTRNAWKSPDKRESV